MREVGGPTAATAGTELQLPQGVGEMVYVPPGWWHAVVNIDSRCDDKRRCTSLASALHLHCLARDKTLPLCFHWLSSLRQVPFPLSVTASDPCSLARHVPCRCSSRLPFVGQPLLFVALPLPFFDSRYATLALFCHRISSFLHRHRCCSSNYPLPWAAAASR